MEELNVQKTRTLYKGDVIAGSFYLFIGFLGLIISILIYYFTQKLGYYYLSIGMAVFSAYMLGKGSFMIYLYNSRFIFYKKVKSLERNDIKEERRFTRYRVLKKKKNRRRYIYTILISSIVAFGGFFHQEKGLIGATCIPIVLMSAIEFTVGLLTEFRLSEYLKHLHKLSIKFDSSNT